MYKIGLTLYGVCVVHCVRIYCVKQQCEKCVRNEDILKHNFQRLSYIPFQQNNVVKTAPSEEYSLDHEV